eukprot:tig00022075_g23646.t1
MGPNPNAHADEEAAPEIPRLQAGDVAALVRQPPPRVAIVDVREPEDFAQAHLKGAVNAPTSSFESHVRSLVEQFKEHDQVVFHCALSKQRGPKCAAAFEKALHEVFPASKTKTVVMKGGFNGFEEQFRADGSLFVGSPAAAAPASK